MEAIAVFSNGTVIFSPVVDGTLVTIRLKNLPKNSIHAIHIHEYGDPTQGCKSMGGHWNPYHTNHGSLLGPERHAGDLCNNIITNSRGNVTYQYIDPVHNIQAILGRSVVIHEKGDDLGLGGNKQSLITGNAGARLECAIIGIRNPTFSGGT